MFSCLHHNSETVPSNKVKTVNGSAGVITSDALETTISMKSYQKKILKLNVRYAQYHRKYLNNTVCLSIILYI